MRRKKEKKNTGKGESVKLSSLSKKYLQTHKSHYVSRQECIQNTLVESKCMHYYQTAIFRDSIR